MNPAQTYLDDAVIEPGRAQSTDIISVQGTWIRRSVDFEISSGPPSWQLLWEGSNMEAERADLSLNGTDIWTLIGYIIATLALLLCGTSWRDRHSVSICIISDRLTTAFRSAAVLLSA